MLQKGSLQCTVLGQTCATLCLVFPHWVLDISPLILSVNPVLLSKLFHGCLYPNNITGLCKIQTLYITASIYSLCFQFLPANFSLGKSEAILSLPLWDLLVFCQNYQRNLCPGSTDIQLGHVCSSFDHQLFPRDSGPLLFLGSSRVLYFHTHRDLTIVYDLADAWWENLEALVQGDKPILPSNYALRSKNCFKYCSP